MSNYCSTWRRRERQTWLNGERGRNNNAAALETLSQLFLQSLSLIPTPPPAMASISPSSMSFPLTRSTRRSVSLPRSTSRTTSALAGPLLLRPPLPTPPIPDAEKNQIKALIVSLMLKVPRRIRPQLFEAFSSSHEFPLATTPPSTASSVAPTPSSSSFAAPSTPLASASTASPSSLPEIFVKTAQLIFANATASSPNVLCPFFESQHFCCEIFHSPNSIEFL